MRDIVIADTAPVFSVVPKEEPALRNVILALVGACSLAIGVAAWQVEIVGTARHSTDVARAMAVDPDGHVVIAGVTQNTGIPQDFTVLKVDGSSGAALWQKTIHGTAPSTQGGDGANAVAVDAAGDVFAAGVITNVGTGADFIVVKFDEVSAVELWRQTINGTANGFDSANTVAVDAAGDVVAAGFLGNTGTGGDFSVIKFHGGTGTELWRRSITDGRAAFDSATAVVVDADGDVIVAGVLASASTGDNFAVLKFDGGSGAELWRQAIYGTAFGGAAQAVALDAAGDVVAAGALTNAGSLTDFAVAKFDGASGVEHWRRSINGQANRPEEARTVAVNAAGDVIAAGAIDKDFGRDFSVVKFAGTSGTELWRRDDFGGGNAGIDFASAVALDAAGDVVAAGFLERAEPAGFTVVKLDGASGVDRWRQIITGTGFGSFANAVAVNVAGDVVAAGGVADAGRARDFTVVKFDGASGSERWRRQLDGSSPAPNRAGALAVDPAGHVVAAGELRNAETDSDFTVLKLDGANGAERWRRMINGTANGFDRANAVAVDAAGDVVAAGMIIDAGGAGGFTVLKLGRHRGAERWRTVIHGPGQGGGFVNAVVADAAGDVLVAGTTSSNLASGLAGFTVVKLEKSSGAESWRTVIAGQPFARNDRASAVAVDAVGDVVAAGAITTAPSRGFAVVKLDGASGRERWRYFLTGTSASEAFDGASKVAVDAAGSVVAAGTITNTGTQADFAVTKVNGVTGVELWHQTLNGSANGPDRANAVALDAAGDVLAAGFLANTATGSDLTVVKFDGVTGSERWRQVVPAPSGCCIGGALAVTVDAAGDVVAAGWTVDPDASPNYFTILKFDGASGVEHWRRIIPTPSGCCLSGVSAVDAAGDVVAAGSIQDNSGSHYTVVKLRGSDGGDFGTNACQGAGSFRVRGRVRMLSRSDTPEVTLTLTGPAGCQETTTTSSVGHYAFRKLRRGTYTLTPAKAGCTFVPASQTVTLEEGAPHAHFRGTCGNEKGKKWHTHDTRKTDEAVAYSISPLRKADAERR